MSEYLKRGIGRNKKISVLSVIILALFARLFFSVVFGEKVLAEKPIDNNFSGKSIVIDPLKNIEIENFFEKKDSSKLSDSSKYKFKREVDSDREAGYVDIVEGHPIEKMTSEIAKKDKKVAAFLIAIAKKESNWGKYSPKKNGKDCFNYWGYRGNYNATVSGYSCFDSPAQAVSVVGGRIEDLIRQEIDTPEEMIVWKCGRSCAWDNSKNVQSWIDDVKLYYNKINS